MLVPVLSCPSGSTGAARHGGSSAKAGCAPVSEDAKLGRRRRPSVQPLNEGRTPSTPVFPQRCSGVAGEERQKARGVVLVGNRATGVQVGPKKGEILFRPQGRRGRRGRRRVKDGNLRRVVFVIGCHG